MPPWGVERRAYRAAKFGSWERSHELDARLAAVGTAEGIAFAFEKIARTPNTLAAHRLIRLAAGHGVQDTVVEALFRAYFAEGRDVGDRVTLLDVAAGAGLGREGAGAELDGGDGLRAIRAAEDEARRLGVEGVPFFVIIRELALSGAQPPDRLPRRVRASGECRDGRGRGRHVCGRAGPRAVVLTLSTWAARWPTGFRSAKPGAGGTRGTGWPRPG